MKNIFDNNECKTILNFLHEDQQFKKILIRKDRCGLAQKDENTNN